MTATNRSLVVSRINLTGHKREKQEARERVAKHGQPMTQKLMRYQRMLAEIPRHPLSQIDRKVKHMGSLTFEEAFCGMCYAVAASNAQFFEATLPLFREAAGAEFDQAQALACGTAFLQLMAAKESFLSLTPEEVAGLVAATMMDLVVEFSIGPVLETSGMGGDKGFEIEGKVFKTLNASTLSALVLASMGVPVMKHGSYGNTSAVGSTETIEKLGAQTDYSSVEMLRNIWESSGFCFTDAHWCKTVHDLSHLLRMETINHVVGPMTPPLDPTDALFKVMGVNEKVNPRVIAEAYTILHNRGWQKVAGVAVVAGMDQTGLTVDIRDEHAVKEAVVLDELSPYASVVAFAYAGKYLGTFKLTPEDFGISIDPTKVLVGNHADLIHEANLAALQGKNPDLASYLAMNAALGMFVHTYLGQVGAMTLTGPNKDLLRWCYDLCRQAITTGRPWIKLTNYISVTDEVFAFSGC